MEVGRYFLDTELTIPTGVTVIGGFKSGFADANRIYPGAATTIDDMTVLDGNSLFYTKPTEKHRVATVRGTLDGVLVRNGHVRNGNGGGLYIDGGTVQNCIIKGNVAMHVPSYGDFLTANAALGGGVYIASGKLINSVVAYNMSNQGYGVAGATGDVINCTVTANTYAPVPVQVKTGTFHHFKHWREAGSLPWGTGIGVYPSYGDDPSEHLTPDMGSFGDGTGITSEFDPGEITLTGFYLAQTEVTMSQYAVFANAIDLTFDSNTNTRNVVFATGYLNSAGVASDNMKNLVDPSTTSTTVDGRFGFPGAYLNNFTVGQLFQVNYGSYYGLRKVGSDYVYYKSLTSGQVQLHLSNESMGLVSWYGSLAFSLWIGGTLPTEAQWEFAARRTASGTGASACNDFQYSGSDDLNSVGWNSGNNTPADNVHEVGTKAANEIGLYDMTGNQLEWCADWINNTGTGSASRVYYPDYNNNVVNPGADAAKNKTYIDPVWKIPGSSRAIRGGGWTDAAGSLSLAFRNGNMPANVYTGVGFRPVLVP
jgi:formylglycine-generating enzyme required for sulfatase activity